MRFHIGIEFYLEVKTTDHSPIRENLEREKSDLKCIKSEEMNF